MLTPRIDPNCYTQRIRPPTLNQSPIPGAAGTELSTEDDRCLGLGLGLGMIDTAAIGAIQPRRHGKSVKHLRFDE